MAIALYIALVGAIGLGVGLGGAITLWLVWYFEPIRVSHTFSEVTEKEFDEIVEKHGFSDGTYIAPPTPEEYEKYQRETPERKSIIDWLRKRLP